MLKIVSYSVDETITIGRQFARILKPGETISLLGDLGAGKTVFVKGVAEALGYKGTVTSPTFTLVREYGTVPILYHADFFRIRKPADAPSIGLEDYITERSILVVEWANQVEEFFNSWNWVIEFSYSNNNDIERQIVFRKVPPEHRGTLYAHLQQFNSIDE